MLQDELDDAIRLVYGEFPGAVDEIVCDLDEATRFATAVKERVPAEAKVVLRRLMTLRKRGDHKGGLARKAR